YRGGLEDDKRSAERYVGRRNGEEFPLQESELHQSGAEGRSRRHGEPERRRQPFGEAWKVEGGAAQIRRADFAADRADRENHSGRRARRPFSGGTRFRRLARRQEGLPDAFGDRRRTHG